MNSKDPKIIWRKIFGWKVGDTCAVQLKTKKVYGVINRLSNVTIIPEGIDIPSAVIEYDTKSPIPRRQVIPLRELLEDDRND